MEICLNSNQAHYVLVVCSSLYTVLSTEQIFFAPLSPPHSSHEQLQQCCAQRSSRSSRATAHASHSAPTAHTARAAPATPALASSSPLARCLRRASRTTNTAPTPAVLAALAAATAPPLSGFCYRASVTETAGATQAALLPQQARMAWRLRRSVGHDRSRLAFRAQLARQARRACHAPLPLRCDTVCGSGGRVTRCGRCGEGSVS